MPERSVQGNMVKGITRRPHGPEAGGAPGSVDVLDVGGMDIDRFDHLLAGDAVGDPGQLDLEGFLWRNARLDGSERDDLEQHLVYLVAHPWRQTPTR